MQDEYPPPELEPGMYDADANKRRYNFYTVPNLKEIVHKRGLIVHGQLKKAEYIQLLIDGDIYHMRRQLGRLRRKDAEDIILAEFAEDGLPVIDEDDRKQYNLINHVEIT